MLGVGVRRRGEILEIAFGEDKKDDMCGIGEGDPMIGGEEELSSPTEGLDLLRESNRPWEDRKLDFWRRKKMREKIIKSR